MRREWACSSVVEHCVDIAGVASSILATPTIFSSTASPAGSTSEERPDFGHEAVELVVMQPMAGILELDHARGLEMPGASVAVGVGGPAPGAVQQQGRAGDRRPQGFD